MPAHAALAYRYPLGPEDCVVSWLHTSSAQHGISLAKFGAWAGLDPAMTGIHTATNSTRTDWQTSAAARLAIDPALLENFPAALRRVSAARLNTEATLWRFRQNAFHLTATPVCAECVVARPWATRLEWRQPALPACTTHQRILITRCPTANCGHPLREGHHGNIFAGCPACGRALVAADSPPATSVPGLPDALQRMRIALQLSSDPGDTGAGVLDPTTVIELLARLALATQQPLLTADPAHIGALLTVAIKYLTGSHAHELRTPFTAAQEQDLLWSALKEKTSDIGLHALARHVRSSSPLSLRKLHCELAGALPSRSAHSLPRAIPEAVFAIALGDLVHDAFSEVHNDAPGWTAARSASMLIVHALASRPVRTGEHCWEISQASLMPHATGVAEARMRNTTRVLALGDTAKALGQPVEVAVMARDILRGAQLRGTEDQLIPALVIAGTSIAQHWTPTEAEPSGTGTRSVAIAKSA